MGQTTQTITSDGTHLYLRCNATGWDVTSATRLTPTDTPDELELVYEVSESWMVGSGDQCVLTETPEEDGWGSFQNSFVADGGSLQVPGASALVNQTGTFTVSYPELGEYRATVDWASKTIDIGPAAPEPGDVAWEVEGPFDASVDAAGRPYLHGSGGISRVDAASGATLWSNAEIDTVNPTCGDEDVLVALGSGELLGLDPATGAELWSSATAGTLLGCAGDFAFVRDGSQLSAVSFDNGAIEWTVSTTGTVSLDGEGTAPVLLDVSASAFARLDVSSGATSWTAPLPSGAAPVFDNGSLHLIDAATLTKVDLSTGQSLWTHAYAGDREFSALPDGDVVITRSSSDPDVVLLDATGGAVVWSRPWAPASPSGPTEAVTIDSVEADASGRLFLIQTSVDILTGTPMRQVHRIEPSDGTVLWSFERNLGVAEDAPLDRIEHSDEDSVLVRYTIGSPSGGLSKRGMTSLDVETGALRFSFTEDLFNLEFGGAGAGLLFFSESSSAGSGAFAVVE